ncbi:MAG: hypothetical protein V4812_07575 [Pseudomonadota bacterium]
MNRLSRLALLVVASTLSLPAAAKSCYVTERTSPGVPPPVNQEVCFEHLGTQEDSIDWACRDDKAVRSSRRDMRDSCPPGAFGRCTATLTPESLISERATGTRTGENTFPSQVPEGAQIVTHYYKVSDRGQARTDCEQAGGQWSQ